MRRRAQQKAREAVPAVLKRWSASLESAARSDRRGVQRRNGVTETECAARAITQFRLPVVHQMVHKVEAKPDLVRALDPARISIEGVGLVVASLRVPSLRIAEGRIVRAEAKRWQPAFQGVRAVCPGNPQD